MTKNQLRIKVRKMIWEVAPYVGLDDQWDITVEYPDRLDNGDGYDIAGGCDSKWQYKQCALSFSYVCVKNYTDSELRCLIIHELLHASLQEMREWSDDWVSCQLYKAAYSLCKCALWVC